MRSSLHLTAAALLLAACAEQPDPAPMPSGAELFARHCSACHGATGEGDGPVAAAMAVSVPNLRTLSQRADGSFPRDAVLAYIDGRNLPVAHGDRYMPVWGDVFAESELESSPGEQRAGERLNTLADFLAQIQY